MAKYAMSDIHGCYDEFMRMLDLIKFSSEDELYIIGDIFDRGLKPIEVLDYISSKKNIHLIKGNHEYMFEQFYEDHDSALWFHNGGKTTFGELMFKGSDYLDYLYAYIKKLPFIKVVDNYILVHAGLYLPDDYKSLTVEQIVDLQEQDMALWDRSNIGCEQQIEGYTVVCGHTPVQSINSNYDDVKIIEQNGTIYIDCGCVFKKSNGKLACLRLDDKKEFYV